ncbi:MAG: GNAT family N-acetyltransferase [Actinomycetota bacterium]
MTSPIPTERLELSPLRVDDAEEMAVVLGDDRLHTFTAGGPATATELRERYERLVAGPADPDVQWMNWVVRLREDGVAVGTVQATVASRGDRRSALVAWVIGVPWQGRGFGSEAATALVEWLRGSGVGDVAAHVHPGHRASEVVATRAGLRPTPEVADGERAWRLPDVNAPGRARHA